MAKKMTVEQMEENLTQDPETGDLIHEMKSGDETYSIRLSKKDLIDIIREAKRPDERTERKLQEEEENRQRAMNAMIEIARQQELSTKQRQSACRHSKPDGSTAISGQICSDGLIHPICVICQCLLKPYPPPREMIAGMGIS